MKKRKTIIGIHGLGKKPPKELLEEWWRLSLQEGLSKINSKIKLNEFDLVYWADVLNDESLDMHAAEGEDDKYLDERYFPSDENDDNEGTSFSQSLLQSLKEQFNNLVFNKKLHENYPSVTDFIIKHFFNELSIYFDDKCEDKKNKGCTARNSIRDSLISELTKHKNDDILLIAHSMGSIIAYDVLMYLEKEIKINTLITIGSPLGVPFIYKKIQEETAQSNFDKMKIPDSITNAWYNFADPKDKLAANYKFDNLFRTNIKGVIAKSAIVNNDYKTENGANPHKSFGYLRTHQVAAIVGRFLAPKPVKLTKWFISRIKGVLEKAKEKFK